ncbi:MAG TPA: response regulator transcription factor [Candidatus Baltobacteraceae bacterium]|nr:response regulator transcription factor [Candidatus Baltobacteraceae bacterium]
MAQRSVLVVDDEAQIGDILKSYLERDGYHATVCGTVAQALDQLDAHRPDLILLDVTLPDGSGLDVLRTIREHGVPVIMLTARAEEVDRIIGLELGADDYVTKPFSPREVVARVRAVMRRFEEPAAAAAVQGQHLRLADLDIDLAAHEVRVRGDAVPLTPSEFRILTVLGEHPGQVFSRAQLLDKLDDDGTVYERTLDRHINNLRKKIEVNPQEPEYVLTVYGVGYKMRKP